MVYLSDGRVIQTPLEFYPTLKHAPRRARANWRWLGRTGVEWPDLDLQLSIEGLVAGKREHVPSSDWRAGQAARLAAYKAGRKSSHGRAA